MTMVVYTFLCKSVSSTMFSYIYMHIGFVYFAISDMCLYVCMFVCLYSYTYLYLYVDCTLLCGGNKEYLSISIHFVFCCLFRPKEKVEKTRNAKDEKTKWHKPATLMLI